MVVLALLLGSIEIEFPQELTLKSSQPIPLAARWVTPKALPLTAWSNFGRIEQWRFDGTQWVGSWMPPDPVYPGDLQIVVSALQGGTVLFSAQTVAVSAQIVLPGKSEPDAQVEILLGKNTFGPVKAGPDGRFSLPITVPPNVQTAVARSKDKLGNVFKKTVDLFVPKVSKTAVACPSTRVLVGSAPVPVQLVNGSRSKAFFTPPQKSGRVDFALEGGSCAFDVLADKAVDARVVFDPPYLAGRTTLAVYALDRFGNTTRVERVTVKEGDVTLGSAELNGDRYELALVAAAGVEQRKLRVDLGAFAKDVTLEQVPDRGVRLTAKRDGEHVLIHIVPATEPVQATDARGAVALASVVPGTFRVRIEAASEFVLATHAPSGTSVMVRLDRPSVVR